MLSPLPSSPALLLPQHRTCPAVVYAQACVLPSAMPAAPATPMTATGFVDGEVVPSPSWPFALLPQQRTSPIDSTAHVVDWRAAIAITPLSPITGTAVGRS